MLHFQKKYKFIAFLLLTSIFLLFFFLDLLFYNLEHSLKQWLKANATVSLFLSETISNPDYQRIYSILSQDFRVTNTQETSSVEAFGFIQEQLQSNLNFPDSVHKNLFPTTIDFNIRPEYYSNVSEIVSPLSQIEGVIDLVQPDQQFLSIVSFTENIQLYIVGIYVLEGFLFLFLLAFLINIVLKQQHEERQLLQLFGAPGSSIYLPFLREVGMVLVGSGIFAYGFIILWLNALSPKLFLEEFFPDFYSLAQTFIWEYFSIGIISLLFVGEYYVYWLLRRWYGKISLPSR